MYKSVIDELDVSDKTKINYNYKAERCTNLGVNIIGNEEDIIEKIRHMDSEKYNSIIDYINVNIVIRRKLGKPYEKIIEYREKLRAVNKNTQTETNERFLSKKQPSVADLLKFTNDKYLHKDYQSFIINFLIINDQCRLADVDCIISKKENDDDKQNYLIIGKKDSVKFIRNSYKNSESHGTKVGEYKDRKLYDSCVKLLGKEKNVFLLSVKNGNHAVNPNNFVRDRTLNKLGAGNYFKILLLESSKNDLLIFSGRRGTSVEVILRSYNVDQKF